MNHSPVNYLRNHVMDHGCGSDAANESLCNAISELP